MKEYIQKVPNGKLVKIKITIEKSKIKNLQIVGDFFLYPEEALPKIEKALIGKSEGDVFQTISDATKDAKFFGFSIEDIANLIKRAFENEMETNNR